MKLRIGLGLAVVVWARALAAYADNPPAPAPAPAAVPPHPAKVSAATAAVVKPLKLSIGDIRNYMMPRDLEAAITAQDPDKSAIVVEGKRELLPMEEIDRLPPGLAGIWHSIKHPSQSWRLLLPDAYAPAMGPTVDKVPPPIFRWGP